MAEMERAAPGTSLRRGWLDRSLGLRSCWYSYRGVQMGMNMPSIAFTGNGPELAMSSIDEFTLAQVDAGAERARWSKALLALNADAPQLMSMPAHTAISAIGDAYRMQHSEYHPRDGADYPKCELGTAMRDVARLIKADIGLQIAAVDYGDWDMHSGCGDSQLRLDARTSRTTRSRDGRVRDGPRTSTWSSHRADAVRVR